MHIYSVEEEEYAKLLCKRDAASPAERAACEDWRKVALELFWVK